MRIVLVTGKGGVGKTTIAASTALAAADAGYRVLVTSTDPAHSLADALEVGLASDPTPVATRLQGQQIDTRQQLDKYWGSIRRQLIEISVRPLAREQGREALRDEISLVAADEPAIARGGGGHVGRVVDGDPVLLGKLGGMCQQRPG